MSQSFQVFTERLDQVLINYSLTRDDIAYININSDFWIHSQDFFDLTMPPKVWIDFTNPSDDFYWYVDQDFKVVLKDFRWFEYTHDFVLRASPRRAARRFFTKPRQPQKSTLFDFVKLKMNNKKGETGYITAEDQKNL